jgi:hypothetical protein
VAGVSISGFIHEKGGAGSVGIFLGEFGIAVTEQAIRDRDGGRLRGGTGRERDLCAEAEHQGDR